MISKKFKVAHQKLPQISKLYVQISPKAQTEQIRYKILRKLWFRQRRHGVDIVQQHIRELTNFINCRRKYPDKPDMPEKIRKARRHKYDNAVFVCNYLKEIDVWEYTEYLINLNIDRIKNSQSRKRLRDNTIWGKARSYGGRNRGRIRQPSKKRKNRTKNFKRIFKDEIESGRIKLK